jgi:hypothetical protein
MRNRSFAAEYRYFSFTYFYGFGKVCFGSAESANA